MSYFLLNKFQGAFFGSLAISKLATQNQQLETAFDNEKSFHQKQQWFLFLNQTVVSEMPNQEKLLNIWWKTVFDNFPITQENLADNNFCSIFSLSVLPVVLYYHDYWHYLAEFVTKRGKQLQKSQIEIDNVLVWCYAVRLALRGELASYNLTEGVVQGTKIQQDSVILWLKKLELFFLEGLSLEELLEDLCSIDHKEIALSLFCFLSNPQDFELTVRQALFLEQSFARASALSGVLSGAYNGLTGIPINWRNLYWHQSFDRQLIVQIEEMIDEWLGIDQGKNKRNTSSVITAPQILQPRPSLQVISQQEYQSRLI